MEERIISLETRFAFQEELINELNRVVFRQQEQLDKQDQQLADLKGKMIAVQASQVGDSSEEAPPPHY